MLWSSDTATPASENYPNIQASGRTYENALPGGYTANHAYFKNDNDFWHGKASTSGNGKVPPRKATIIRGQISVRVSMGTILPGGRNITTIGVSIYYSNSIKVLCAEM